jgi:hypothetical protein
MQWQQKQCPGRPPPHPHTSPPLDSWVGPYSKGTGPTIPVLGGCNQILDGEGRGLKKA